MFARIITKSTEALAIGRDDWMRDNATLLTKQWRRINALSSGCA